MSDAASRPHEEVLTARPHWPEIEKFVADRTGPATLLLHDVENACKAGLIPGPPPKYHTFTRHQKQWRRRKPAPKHASRPARATQQPAATGHAPGAEGRVVPPAGEDRRKARERLEVAQARVVAAGHRVLQAGLLTEELSMRARLVLKPGNRPSGASVRRLHAVSQQMERFAEYLDGLVSPSALPAQTAEESDEVCDIVLDRSCDAPAAAVPSDGQEYGLGLPTGAPVLPRPAYGAAVGRVRESKTELDARFRFRLAMPVLHGQLTARDVAIAVRSVAAGKPLPRSLQSAGGVEDLVAGFPRAFLERYAKLTSRSVGRWVARLLDKQKLADEVGEPRSIAASILEHRQPPAVRTARVLKPPVIELVHDLYETNPHWSMALVARKVGEQFGITVSERSVQRELTGTLDIDRLLSRGGDAADVLVRKLLYRTVKRANEVWIGDHSFLSHELLPPGGDDPARDLVNFDFQFEVALERQTQQGVVRRERSPIWMTLWVDAATRLHVGMRIWAGAPNTRRTLVSLFDAVRRYGVPERIYTDNGSDFKSQELRDLLAAAGIAHAFSRPYTPQGRGIIERAFGVIKKGCLAGLPGYHGGRHDIHYDADDLLTLEELELEVWSWINRYVNHAVHGTTKRIPAEHYVSLIGARDLRGLVADEGVAARALALLPTEKRTLQTYGIMFEGLPYWSDAFGGVPVGTPVMVHNEPDRWRSVHVSVPDPEGVLRYVGLADAYTADSPPPSFVDMQREEAAYRRDAAARAAARDDRQRQRKARAKAREEGRETAGALLEAVADESTALASPPPVRGLISPPGKDVPEPSDSPAPPAMSPAAPSVTPATRNGGPHKRASRSFENPFK